MNGDDSLDHLIGRLYEAVMEPELWSEVMTLCGRYVGGIAGHMLTIDKRSNLPIFSVCGGEMATLEHEGAYVEHYMAIDPRLKSNMLSDAPLHDWRCCHGYLNQKFVDRDEFYQDFLIPIGGRYMLAAWVDDTPELHSVIGLHRSSKHSPFNEVDRAAAQRFGHHLQRALRLHANTQSLQAKADLGASVIDALVWPLFIVDGKARVLLLNTKAEQVLTDTSGDLIYYSGMLACRNPASALTLSRLITRATGQPATGGAMNLHDSAGRQVLITPLPANSALASDWQRPMALVLIKDRNAPVPWDGTADFGKFSSEAFSTFEANESPEDPRNRLDRFTKTYRLTHRETDVLWGVDGRLCPQGNCRTSRRQPKYRAHSSGESIAKNRLQTPEGFNPLVPEGEVAAISVFLAPLFFSLNPPLEYAK